MSSEKFKNVEVPEWWGFFWSKYPDGYIIQKGFDNLISQVNKTREEMRKQTQHMNELELKLLKTTAYMSGFMENMVNYTEQLKDYNDTYTNEKNEWSDIDNE